MKIAILVHNLTGGGAERVAAMWATGFASRGHDVTVVTYDAKGSPITYQLPQVVRHENIVSYYPSGVMRTLRRIILLRSFIKRERPDVVIDVIRDYWKIASIIGLKCKKISTEHATYERPKNTTVPLNLCKKIYLNRLYDHVTVLTQADKKVIGRRLKHVTVLPNPLAFQPATEMPRKEKIVLATGRLDAWHVKGFDVLIKAWANIADKTDGWKLQIAGGSNGSGLGYLQKLCKDYQVSDTVEFIGYQSDILPYYQAASVFVLSSRFEGFGLVLIEAMSQGCACIACDYKSRQKEIMPSEDQGLLCEPENVKQLSQSIWSLIYDETKRKAMGVHAIERSSDFSLDKIMDKWDEILRK